MDLRARWHDAQRMGREGWFFAKAYSVLAVLVAIFKGPELFRAHSVAFVGLILAYAAGCVLAGIIVGFALPLTKHLVGRIPIAILALLPLGLALGLLDLGGTLPSNWYRELFAPTLLFAIVFGTIFAIITWLRGYGR